MMNVYLLLGSNLGDRQGYLKEAIAHIENEIAPVVKASAIYETQSWGKTDAPDYLNQVVELLADMDAHTVLQKILDIETRMGRMREEKWGSRIIDIDILFFNKELIRTEKLIVPHPRIPSRRFVLVPLTELSPGMKHPELGKTMSQLLKECPDTLDVKKI